MIESYLHIPPAYQVLFNSVTLEGLWRLRRRKIYICGQPYHHNVAYCYHKRFTIGGSHGLKMQVDYNRFYAIIYRWGFEILHTVTYFCANFINLLINVVCWKKIEVNLLLYEIKWAIIRQCISVRRGKKQLKIQPRYVPLRYAKFVMELKIVCWSGNDRNQLK